MKLDILKRRTSNSCLMSSEWKNWDIENGDDYFIHRDLPDIWQLLQEELAKVAPVIWDERIKDYFDQVNIYTSNEIYESGKWLMIFYQKVLSA